MSENLTRAPSRQEAPSSIAGDGISGQRSSAPRAGRDGVTAGVVGRFATLERPRSRLESWFLIAADLFAVAGSVALVLLIPLISPSIEVLVFAAMTPISLGLAGTYQKRTDVRLHRDFPRLVGALAVPLLFVLPFSLMVSTNPASLFALVLILAGVLLVVRAQAYAVIRALRQRRVLAERTVVVGTRAAATELAEWMRSHPECGLEPVGLVVNTEEQSSAELPAPLLGRLDDLATVATSPDVDRFVVSLDRMRDTDLSGQLPAILHHGVNVDVVPRFSDSGVVPPLSRREVAGIPLQPARRFAPHRPTWAAKRAIDLVAASSGLLLLTPFFVVLAVAVRLSSPGPVIFRQVRIGQDGQPFELLKFRSMRLSDDRARQFSVRGHEDEITRVGAVMRRASIDELPQLWNVLRGDMSLVGPRPERPGFVDQFSKEVPDYCKRHRLPVGLTGWAQVNGLRGDTSISDRVRFDNHYIEFWSLWFDAIIMVRTVRAVVSGFVNQTVQ